MTAPAIVIRPAAAHDIDDQADYLSQRSVPLAVRYLQAATQTFQEIARMPLLGSVFSVSNPALQELRTWPIRGFRKQLIFYLPGDDGIEVVRVLHGARNLQTILEQET